METPCPQDGKLSFKDDELLVGDGMKMWKGNGNTATLVFSLKGLEILHRERKGHVNTIVMEHFNSILFHKSGPANKHHTYQSIKWLYYFEE